jgi:hypothetical protein
VVSRGGFKTWEGWKCFVENSKVKIQKPIADFSKSYIIHHTSYIIRYLPLRLVPGIAVAGAVLGAMSQEQFQLIHHFLPIIPIHPRVTIRRLFLLQFM